MNVNDWAARWYELRYEKGAFGRRRAREETKRHVRRHLRTITDSIGDTELDLVRPVDVREMVRTAGGIATCNRLRTTARALFADAVRAGELERSPAADLEPLREVSAEKQTITPTQLAAVLDRLRGQSAAPVVALMGYAGLRLTEALTLRWEQIEHSPRLEAVFGPDDVKEGKPKRVPLPQQVLPHFHSVGSGPVCAKQSERTVRRQLSKACREAGVPEVLPHGLRHSAAQNWEAAGLPVSGIAALLGHSSITTTQTYLRGDRARMEAVVDAVAEIA